MKNLALIIIIIFFAHVSSAQIKSVGLIAGGGETIVDVDKVVDPYDLSDWNTWSMVFKGFAEYQIGETSSLGLEAGANRLYYWEYKAPGYSYFNWRTEWTTNAVIYVSQSLGERFFIQAGAGFHIFQSGTVAGLMASVGASFPVSEKISVPVFLRIEPVFGVATPVAVNIGTGIRYNLIK
jgi:hypothetical protein